MYKGYAPKVLRLAPGGGVLLLGTSAPPPAREFTMCLFLTSCRGAVHCIQEPPGPSLRLIDIAYACMGLVCTVKLSPEGATVTSVACLIPLLSNAIGDGTAFTVCAHPQRAFEQQQHHIIDLQRSFLSQSILFASVRLHSPGYKLRET